MPEVTESEAAKDNREKLNGIMGRLNGHKKHIVPVAQLALLVTILYYVIQAAVTIGEIKQFTISNFHKIGDVGLRVDSEISELRVFGCQPSGRNATAIAVLTAGKKKR